MSRLLVFCGTRAAIERFDMLSDWTVIAPTQRAEMIKSFCADPEAKLAVDRSMLVGWRAPVDTIVLFDPSWRYPYDSAENFQAVARVSQSLPAWSERLGQ